MSRQLLLLSHGKSDWGATYEHDHERPLARRGVRDAKRMERFLADVGRVPDLVVHSTVRAARTVELAVEAGDWPSDVRASRDLFEAVDWQAVTERSGELDWLIVPKLLTDR